MKISKVLFLAALLLGLSAVGLAKSPSNCSSTGVSLDLTPNDIWLDGDTIEFVVEIQVVGNQCDIWNATVKFWAPNNPPDNADLKLATDGVVIATGVNFNNGAPATVITSASAGASVLSYDVAHADEDVDGVLYAYVLVTGTQQTAPSVTTNADTSIPNLVIHPDITITKSAEPAGICEQVETEITYSYEVENTGDVDLENVVVLDDICGSPVRGADLVGNDDGVLEVDEIWTYECIDLISQTTTNTVEVTAEDVYIGTEVSDTDSATVTAVEPPVCNITGPTSVCQGAEDVQYCSDVTDADSYLWTIDGDGAISGSATGDCVLVNPTGPGGFTLSLHICYGTCCSDCDLPVDVIPTPDCRITGPESLCQDEIGLAAEYCTDVVASGYLWEVLSGPATIDGANDAMCVNIIPSDLGTILLKLSLYNEVPGNGNCWNSCEIEVTVSECGQTYCGFTQGYYGNTGGTKCGGQTTTELLDALLAFDDVVVGLPGRSITFDTAACIILRLPAGGTASALPVGLGNRNCTSLPGTLVKKNKPEINNVLVGQVVALTLNVRLGLLPCISGDESDGLLGTFVLPDEPFCTVPYGKEEACVKHVDVSGFAGMTVDELLALANTALGGGNISPYTISQINGAVTAINEGFDECRTIVPCIRPEICGNGCDDDGDTLVDGDDPDCAI